MRVWHLCSNRGNSAIAEYALSSARALQAQGFETYFTPLAASPAADRAKAEGLEVRSLSGFSLTDTPAFLRLARAIKPHLILTYGGPETILSKWQMLAIAPATVVRFRGKDVTARHLATVRHRLAHSHVPVIVAPSVYLARKLGPLAAGQLVIPVTLGRDENLYIRRAALADEPPEIVVLGRFDPVKGHAHAFSLMRLALAGWPRERVTPCLHIVGKPANLQSLELMALAAEQGLVLGKDVRLTDTHVADVPSLLSRAALGLVPSIGSETICRVAAEFLLCGTPIAVSGVGSLEDMLFEGAGLSYRGLKDEDAAKLIQGLTLTSLSEGEEAKRRRALRARETCSLAKMGQRLSQILRPYLPAS